MRLVLLLLALCSIHASESPYTAWQQGRPADSLAALTKAAEEAQTWQAWYDAGLCALAAEERALGITYLTRAHHLDPGQPLPTEALASAQVELFPTLSAELGPLATALSGWVGLALALIAGYCLTHGLLNSSRRPLYIVVGTFGLLLVLPAQIAKRIDGGQHLLVTATEASLVDASGNVLGLLPEGTIVRRAKAESWGQRVLVERVDGNRGYIAEADLLDSRLKD